MEAHKHSPEAGFSMVELMVALVLGVILTSGVISVYISSKASYTSGNSLAEVEETGRNALGFMQPLITQAGNTGCSRPFDSRTSGAIPGNIISSAYNPSFTMGSGTNPPTGLTPVFNFTAPVYGYDATGTTISSSSNTTIPSNGGQTATTAPTGDTNANDWSPALTAHDPKTVLWNALNGKVLKYNDVFMVHEALATLVGVTANSDASNLYVANSSTSGVPYTAANLAANEFAIVSNCQNLATAFQITALTASSGAVGYAAAGTPGNGSAFGTTIGTAYSVSPASTYVFFVGQGADNWPALFEAYFPTDGSSTTALSTQELVSGVENMQVLYGVNSDATNQIPNYYATADQVETNNAWYQVVSIRVALVVQSDNYSVDKASTSTTNLYMLGSGRGYNDNLILATPADQRMRRVFMQTFSFRSMLP